MDTFARSSSFAWADLGEKTVLAPTSAPAGLQRLQIRQARSSSWFWSADSCGLQLSKPPSSLGHNLEKCGSERVGMMANA